PDGMRLRALAAGVGVYRGAQRVAYVAPPVAHDAQGTSVAVRMRLVGDRLVESVAHRAADLAYPVLVDPVVTLYALSDPDAWRFVNCTGSDNIAGPFLGYVVVGAGVHSAHDCGYWVWDGSAIGEVPGGLSEVTDDISPSRGSSAPPMLALPYGAGYAG